MISTLRGKLILCEDNSLIVECGGVGFGCIVTRNVLNSLPNLSDEIFLHTYLAVREDAMELYGFKDIEELKAFKMITSVNGVGAKIGIALLSEFTASQLMAYIASEDAKALTAAAGVGIKLAQRIVLELKDKIGNIKNYSDLSAAARVPSKSSVTSEVVEALIALGYNKSEATSAVANLDLSLPSGELIKQALKTLSRRL